MTDLVKVDAVENALIGGDLSKLSPEQRVQYYRQVCLSLGLNPLTKPFNYITLNGKLVLYALKDATDQLRKVHAVSIDDVDIKETDKQFIVTVKGHDKDGRSDVEIGVVNKTDMQGNTANAMMKAVTKGKRRLTLSLCGLGMLDETEVETIPGAQVTITVEQDMNALPEGEAPVKPGGLHTTTKEGTPYIDLTNDELSHHLDGILAALKKNGLEPEDKALYEAKRDEIYRIFKARNKKS